MIVNDRFVRKTFLSELLRPFYPIIAIGFGIGLWHQLHSVQTSSRGGFSKSRVNAVITPASAESSSPQSPTEYNETGVASPAPDQRMAEPSALTTPIAAREGPTPTEVVQQYYRFWNERQYSAMYALLSTRLQSRRPWGVFSENHSFTDAINVTATPGSSESIVNIRIHSKDHDKQGRISESNLEGVWSLVLERGGWKLDAEDVQQYGEPAQTSNPVPEVTEAAPLVTGEPTRVDATDSPTPPTEAQTPAAEAPPTEEPKVQPG